MEQQRRGAGGMSSRATTWLAWSLCALSLALTALSLLLLILNLSHPNTHLYEPWLDNTLTAVFYPTVGAIVASRRSENPVGWLLCLFGLVISISYFCAEYAIRSSYETSLGLIRSASKPTLSRSRGVATP